MAVEVWQAVRPKGRPPRWAFRVTAGGVVAFESAWVAVRFAARSDVEWLAATTDRLAALGRFAGCPGHPGQCEPVLWWGGDIGTDHGATVDGIDCHAEHMFGPVRGGAWYWKGGPRRRAVLPHGRFGRAAPQWPGRVVAV